MHSNYKDIKITIGNDSILYEDIQTLILIEYQNQQYYKKLNITLLTNHSMPYITNGKVLGIVALAAVGFFAAPLLGIGAITGVLVGASIGWRLLGAKRGRNKNLQQTRITSTPGFDSPPQPPTIGTPIPLIFTNTSNNSNGGVRVQGNSINNKITTYENEQTLHSLVSLGLGELVEIDKDRLLIDNQPLDNFLSDTIDIKTVNGLANQSRFENFPFYSQCISPSTNNNMGVSFKGFVIDGSISGNTFRVSENDYDVLVPSENYRLNGENFKVTNKLIDGSDYKIITNRNFTATTSENIGIYQTFNTTYETLSKCTQVDLNFAFELWARDKEDSEIKTYALAFALYIDGQKVGDFYEANAKEGVVRRSLSLKEMPYEKHKIEIISYDRVPSGLSPIRIDASGQVDSYNSPAILNGSAVVVTREQGSIHSLSEINEFIKPEKYNQRSNDRGAPGRITSINEVTYPGDIGHTFMSNYPNLALVELAIKARENIQQPPGYSHLVRKGIKYRNHLAAGNAAIGSSGSVLNAGLVDISDIFIGAIIRNIDRGFEERITNISGSNVTSLKDMNWQVGEKFLIYNLDAINYFPDIFVYTRLNKQGGLKGLNISEKFIDYPSICYARKFCKDNGYYWDGVIEQSTKWNQWVMQESLGSLLKPFKFAGNYGLLPEENKPATDIFNAARILPGSYSQSYPEGNTINAVQITYNENSDDEYRKTDKTITVMTTDAAELREELQIENINYESITNEQQAKDVAARYLKSRRIQNKVVTFSTAIHGFNVREGDIIYVQFGLTEKESEFSGFCLTASSLAASNQTIKLNKKTPENLLNQGYTATVYHLETGNIQENLAFSPLSNGSLTITGLTEEIKPNREGYNGDILIFNRNLTEKKYSVTTIKPQEYNVEITAINWSEDIFDISDLVFID